MGKSQHTLLVTAAGKFFKKALALKAGKPDPLGVICAVLKRLKLEMPEELGTMDVDALCQGCKRNERLLRVISKAHHANLLLNNPSAARSLLSMVVSTQDYSKKELNKKIEGASIKRIGRALLFVKKEFPGSFQNQRNRHRRNTSISQFRQDLFVSFLSLPSVSVAAEATLANRKAGIETVLLLEPNRLYIAYVFWMAENYRDSKRICRGIILRFLKNRIFARAKAQNCVCSQCLDKNELFNFGFPSFFKHLASLAVRATEPNRSTRLLDKLSLVKQRVKNAKSFVSTDCLSLGGHINFANGNIASHDGFPPHR